VTGLEDLMRVFRTLPWLLLAAVTVDAMAAHRRVVCRANYSLPFLDDSFWLKRWSGTQDMEVAAVAAASVAAGCVVGVECG
jgi:hypothetical protein